MSDFSELCPLFNTGVFREIMFPKVYLTDIGTTSADNALVGSAGQAASAGVFTFGRTVVITDAWFRKKVAVGAAETLTINHHSSRLANGTAFATMKISTTVTGQAAIHGYMKMNCVSKTFSSSDILGVNYGTITENNGGVFDILVRYKEK